ncbi:MAG: HAMP domain-containing sensor histidine kinase [Candidatus Omnitrophota bacterium]|nr:HAMP domain-containing histidine kinase [Candidatus Omnitrophota bacterium]MBA3066156.1 HAMP domain-containing histidine kinase [bacterium]MBU2529260.1 HAMP domain-containing histidine kinase [bacterium]MBU3930231.1 HAMP domain-containing histidine kinase [bacterium]MBU4122103.1 HAMP domain-containing histidine kinase [bacterium]
MKIRNKILMFFSTVAAVPLVFFIVLMLAQRRSAGYIENSLFALTNSASKITEHFLLNAQKSVMAQSYLPSNLFPGGDNASRQAYLKRIHRKYKIFSSVMFTDMSGNVISRYGENPPDEFKNIFRARRMEDTPHVIKTEGGSSIALVSKTNKNNYLAALINPDSLLNILEKILPVEGASFYIRDNAGKTLFSDISGDEKNASPLVAVRYSDIDIYKRTLNRGGRKIFEVIIPIAGFPGWRICLSAPHKVVFKSLRDAKFLGIFFSVVSFMLAGYLSFYFSSKISAPLEEISKSAGEFAQGNFSYRPQIRTGDEMENLALQLNKMADKISAAQSGRDAKIRSSSRDLANAYKEIAVKNEKLARSDKYKSQFLATMSHELRTPMNAIIGFTDLLKDGIYGVLTAKQKDILSKVQRNSNHLLNLINDILDLSKIEAGRIDLMPENFDLRELINTVSGEIASPGKEVEFRSSCPEGIVLYQDMMRLKQVIFNLLSNAFKFTKKGHVSLSCQTANEIAIIEVEDTGIGIKEEDTGKIFDSFQQADASITRQFQGTGLGLSISKKLIELMGGWVDIKSEFGKGSLFTVHIPYKYEEKKES